jgi:hypothetical protein
MSPKDLRFRKELLLLKGDALRMQIRVELGVVRKRWNGAGMLWSAARTARHLGGWLARRDDTPASGWRSWLQSAARLLLAGQSIARIWNP